MANCIIMAIQKFICSLDYQVNEICFLLIVLFNCCGLGNQVSTGYFKLYID